MNLWATGIKITEKFTSIIPPKNFAAGTQVVIIGLGDTSYDTFCYGAKEIETKLVNAGATLLTAPLHIDVLEHPIPEDEAVHWFESNVDVA